MTKPCRPPRELTAARLSVGRLAALLALLPLSAGCVSRTLSVHSEPPGARVIIDGKHVGETPYDKEYQSYGTRTLVLELPGYVSRHEELPMPLPWWQVFPLDVITDLLLPLGIHDDFSFSFELTPLDPDAGTWEQAHAAFAKEQAARAATLSAAQAAAAADAAAEPELQPTDQGERP